MSNAKKPFSVASGCSSFQSRLNSVETIEDFEKKVLFVWKKNRWKTVLQWDTATPILQLKMKRFLPLHILASVNSYFGRYFASTKSRKQQTEWGLVKSHWTPLEQAGNPTESNKTKHGSHAGRQCDLRQVTRQANLTTLATKPWVESGPNNIHVSSSIENSMTHLPHYFRLRMK